MSTDSSPFLLGDAPLTFDEFWTQASGVAIQLPRGREIANLCADRRAFLLTFAAAMVAHARQLLPAGRSIAAAAEILANYPGHVAVTDETIQAWCRGGQSASPRPPYPGQIGRAHV